MKEILRGILKKITYSLVDIPEKYKEELKREIIILNIKRVRVLSIILCIFVLIIISVILFVDNPKNVDKYVSRNSLYIHVILLTTAVAYILITPRVIKIKESNMRNLRIFHSLVISIVIISCAGIAINNELADQRPFAYIIAIFSIASAVILNAFERYTVFILSYIIYIVGVVYSLKNLTQVYESFFFTLPLIALALVVSGINYTGFVSNFVNNRLVKEKNQQLDSMYRLTEEMLLQRTEQLNQAKEIEQVRTAFFANISHELRTPLNLIFSAEQLLDNIYNQKDIQNRKAEVKKYNDIIKQNCYRLIRLIGNLIDITKIDAGYYSLDLRSYDIVKVVEDITMSTAEYIEDKGIKLIFDTEFEEKVITCDAYKIERIILNLLSNAVKFTPSGGEINVCLSERENKVMIKVKDSGIGVPENMKEQIFERFIQVNKTTTRNREGSGIGLSIVRALVEMHGGRISLISNEGKGSEFIIEIPGNIAPNEGMDEACICEEQENVEKIKIEFSDIYN